MSQHARLAVKSGDIMQQVTGPAKKIKACVRACNIMNFALLKNRADDHTVRGIVRYVAD